MKQSGWQRRRWAGGTGSNRVRSRASRDRSGGGLSQSHRPHRAKRARRLSISRCTAIRAHTCRRRRHSPRRDAERHIKGPSWQRTPNPTILPLLIRKQHPSVGLFGYAGGACGCLGFNRSEVNSDVRTYLPFVHGGSGDGIPLRKALMPTICEIRRRWTAIRGATTRHTEKNPAAHVSTLQDFRGAK